MQRERPADQAANNELHDLVLVAYDGIQALDLTGPHEVFAAANRVADAFEHPGLRYRITVAGLADADVAHDDVVTTESGLRIGIDPLPTAGRAGAKIDTLMIPGGDSALVVGRDDPLVVWLAEIGPDVERLACVCTATFVAAQAGLLADHRVTTHWARAALLAKRFPALDVDPDAIYLEDRGVWSSAGVTAGIDLALAMVEQDLGVDVAQETARWLVVFLRRPGGQSQFAAPVWQRRSADGPIRQAQDMIDGDPSAIGSIAELATAVGYSTRHFTRRFTAEAGVSPSRYIEQVRVCAARHHLESCSDGLDTVAARCGFGSAETLRQVFHRQLGVSPDDYRRRFARSESA